MISTSAVLRHVMIKERGVATFKSLYFMKEWLDRYRCGLDKDSATIVYNLGITRMGK